MKPIERNPDIDIDADEIPPGCYVEEGLNLMHTARHAGIPFGVAGRKTPGCRQTRLNTVGVVIRESDRARFDAALAKKAAAAVIRAGRAA